MRVSRTLLWLLAFSYLKWQYAESHTNEGEECTSSTFSLVVVALLAFVDRRDFDRRRRVLLEAADLDPTDCLGEGD